jgi:hypothetical protein
MRKVCVSPHAPVQQTAVRMCVQKAQQIGTIDSPLQEDGVHSFEAQKFLIAL